MALGCVSFLCDCVVVFLIKKKKNGEACMSTLQVNQIFSMAYSRYYAEACNEWRGPFSRLCAWATQLRRNVAAVVSRLRHCVRFDRPGIRTLDFPH